MRVFLAPFLVIFLALTSVAANAAKPAHHELLSYALGYDLGRNAFESGEDIDIATVERGLRDGFNKSPTAIPVDRLRIAVKAMQERQAGKAAAAIPENIRLGSADKEALSYAVGYDLGRNAIESDETIYIDVMATAVHQGFAGSSPEASIDSLRESVSEMKRRQGDKIRDRCLKPVIATNDSYNSYRVDCGLAVEITPLGQNGDVLIIGIRAINNTSSPIDAGTNILSARQGEQSIRVLSQQAFESRLEEMTRRGRILGGIASVIDAIGTGMGAGLRTETGTFSGYVDSRRVSGSYHAITRDPDAASQGRQAVQERSRQIQSSVSAKHKAGEELLRLYWQESILESKAGSLGIAVVELHNSRETVEILIDTERGRPVIEVDLTSVRNM